MSVDHKEITFETAIEDHLINECGYTKGVPSNYNRELALEPSLLISFLKDSQPKEWEKLVKIHKTDAEKKFIQRLEKELNSDGRGMLDVLRHGITDTGVKFKLAYFKSASNLNPEASKLYQKNILTVIRQVRYSLKNENAIDMVIFLNGLPICTIELKNHLSGQTVKNAIAQYKKDRDPRELIFEFKKRALVHFAVDPDEVYMTTKLAGDDTFFLPFNLGHDKGAGNPPNPNGYKTAYLWEDILSKDSLIDIIAKFVHLQKEEKVVNGKKVIKEALIFPRYHQLDVVRKVEADVKQNGSGKNYLIQHSAGSGKSNSIAWLAHRLSSLHNAKDEAIFDSVVVITDRRVLDKQLQENIYQFEHKQGVVEKIDKHSGQLADALKNGTKIIITTLQKFPFIIEKVKGLVGKSYAVIVDEAHSSQTGESADKMKQVLSAKTLEEASELESEVERAMDEVEEEIVKELGKFKEHANLSFFAFTATPKTKTLEMFGDRTSDDKPVPFHLYSMRQAIEEGFILDVLQNYMTYTTYFNVAKKIEEDPSFDKKKATRALARFVSLHPHNLAQKTEIMIEHFRNVTRHKIGGRAKAMLVTASRLHAVRYKIEFDKYIREKGYGDIKALVAFSGSVKDAEIEYTEPGMNKFSETELPKKFDTDEYQVLLVAEKYQTGFDQPLLHTMFVDKKLSGIKAVQTLSRLNRTCPGKHDTFVLDFVNDGDEIKTAFQDYYESTTLEDNTDPNLLYDLKTKMDNAQVYWRSEVESFAKVFFKLQEKQRKTDQGLLNAYLDPAVDRFKQKSRTEQDDFKSALTSFVRLYSFISQITHLQDIELHKLHAFGKFLLTKLPKDDDGEKVYLDDEVALEYYRLEKTSEGNIELIKGEEGKLKGIKYAGTGKAEKELETLSTIIERLNERFGTEFTSSDQLSIEQIKEDFARDEKLVQQARNNSLENFKYAFEDAFMDIVINRMGQNQTFFARILEDERFQKTLKDMLIKEIYDKLQ